MLDSTNPFAIPADAPIVAGYVDGLYQWSAAGWARFAGKRVTITVKGVPKARVADCERGDLTPAQAKTWAAWEIDAGRRPTIYVSRSDWPEVEGLDGVDYWVADWTGTPHLLPGSVATQYSPGGPYDSSVTNGVWPATDAPPGPPAHSLGDMVTPTPSGDGYWLIDSTGAVVTRGDAQYLGGPNTSPANGEIWGGPPVLPAGQTIVSVGSHPTGQGYWCESSGGLVYAYGAAKWFGNA